MLFGKYVNVYYKKYFFVLALGVLALVAVDWFQLLIPELYRDVINGVNTGYVGVNGVQTPFDLNFLLDKICLPMLVVIAVLVFGRFLWRVCFFGSAIGLETDLRNKMFDRCRHLSQSYYSVNKVGNMMSLFTNDLETVQECFGSGVLMFFDALVLGLLALVKMARMDIVLTLLSLIPMFIMMGIGVIVSNHMTQKWAKRQQAFSALADRAQESFSGIGVIKAFVKEVHEIRSFKKLSKNNEDANVIYTKYATLLDVLVKLFVESVICIILGYGGYLVYKGTFDAGRLVEFIGYFNTIIWPIEAIGMLIEMRSRGRASLNRISELLDTVEDVKDSDRCRNMPRLTGKVEFKNLSFAYSENGAKVLDGLTFTVNAGERVGIIGRTGSGKTTIVDLMLHTYNVADGSLFFDGVDVNEITLHSLRENIAYVPQDNFLFGDTIENNINFGVDDPDGEKTKLSAELAGVLGDVESFPNGFKTVLGERGVTVSGGQKQRISIARALMKDAPILILDDSVSAVDTSTEKTILENLAKTRAGKTTIIIAHRVSTVEKLDKIVWLEDGKAVDVGTHSELYSRCEHYKETVDLQRLEDEHKEENGNA